MQESETVLLREYSPIKDVCETEISLYYPSTFYEILRPDVARKGCVVLNSGRVPILVSFGFELIGLYPPYPTVFELALEPGDFYLTDIPEVIPLAGRWLHESDKFGLGGLLIREFI